jgi:ATP-binding cassette, subfamily C (CFTR/MRP), member 1
MAYNGSRRGSYDLEALFRLVLLVGILSRSVNMIASWFPLIVAGLASGERIQSYLLSGTKRDQRRVEIGTSDVAVSFQNAYVQSAGHTLPLLRAVNISIPRHGITMCHGPTGSGKSMLAKVILGEVPLASGSIEMAFGEVGYCDQTPWIPRGSVRDIICGFDPNPDKARYLEAVVACCLSDDIASFPDRDMKIVLNAGINVSGGQRQRLVGNKTPHLLQAIC